MPNIIDATVVNEAYDTSGNGGRKLVRLENGWLVASLCDTTNKIIYFYVSKNNGDTWSQLCYINISTASTIYNVIVSKGTTVFVLLGTSDGNIRAYRFDANAIGNVNISSVEYHYLFTTETAINGVSLAINPQGTELHACWSSKNSAYPNSFNIRYAKGTINGDGSVTWGTVEQVTTHNSTSYPNAWVNPTIILDRENTPTILAESSLLMLSNGQGGNFNPNCRINIVKKSSELGYSFLNGWTGVTVYDGGESYTQSNPSAIFVPSEINGLPNGRIWVAWHGKDSGSPSYDNIYSSYSDDGGATWSNAFKMTSQTGGAQTNNPSVTANNLGEVHVLYQRYDGTTTNIFSRLFKGDTWSEQVQLTNSNNSSNVSTLFDLSINFTEPLFIYQDVKNNKVGFCGKWTTVEISLVNKVFPNISWNTIAGEDSQVINTKLLINNVEVYSVDSPEGDVSYTINPDILLDTNSMKIVSTDSSGSEETKEFTINKSVGDIPLNKGVIRFDLPATDEIVVWYKQGAGLNVESKIAFGDETKQKTMVKDVLDGDYLINIEEA